MFISLRCRLVERWQVRNSAANAGARRLVCILTSVFVSAIGATGGRCCSTFVFDDGRTRLVGHNLDEKPGFYVPGLVCVNKRGVTKRGISWAHLVRSPETEESQGGVPSRGFDSDLEWTSVYGSVTINTDGLEFPDCGMNEAGLVVCEMSLPVTRFSADDHKPTIFMSQWIQYLLDTFPAVGEVIESANSLNLDGWNWHFLVADASGECAAIEFIDGQAVAHAGDGLPVPVLCNASYDVEVKRLDEYQNSTLRRFLGKTVSRTPRFVRAANLLAEYDPADGVSPLDYSWKVIEEIRIPGWNKWSVLFDVFNKQIHFNTEGERGIRSVSFSGIDFSCEEPSMLLDIHSSPPGDVSDAFVEYSYELNRDFLKQRAKLLFERRLRPLMENGLTAELYAVRFADYPKTTRCKNRNQASD